jgi:hypothetical protein
MNDTDQCPAWSMERRAGRRHPCGWNEANQALEQLAIDAGEHIHDRRCLNARGRSTPRADGDLGRRHERAAACLDSHPTARRRHLDHG